MATLLTNPRRSLSLAEYLLLPYDGRKTEFVNGQIEKMAEASPLHVEIIALLTELIKAHIKAQGLSLVCYAGVGIEIPRTDAPHNVRDPDLVVCDRAQWKAMRHLTKAIFLEGLPPALAIEVASPGDTGRDTVDKRLEYALARVPEYWIINPVDDYVLVLTLDGDAYTEIGEFRGDEAIISKLFPSFNVTADHLLDPA